MTGRSRRRVAVRRSSRRQARGPWARRAGKNLAKRRSEVEPAEPVRLRCVGVSPRLLPLTDLNDGDCHYPYGGDRDDEPILFCGHPRLKGSRYCAPHFRLTRDDGTSSERAAGPILLRLVDAA